MGLILFATIGGFFAALATSDGIIGRIIGWTGVLVMLAFISLALLLR